MNRLFYGFLLSLVFLCGTAHAEPKWLDQSHAAFFPKSVGSIVDVQSQFPVLWWDVLVVESSDGKAPDWSNLQANCLAFAKANDGLISKIFCGASLSDLTKQAPILEAWAKDYPLRHKRPTDAEISAKMDEVLAQASLPIGPLVQILRHDPYHSLPELQKLATSNVSFKLEQRGGFFYDSKTERVLIPVQFAFPANETAKARQVFEKLSMFCEGIEKCRTPMFIGAHSATFENEMRVKDDLHAVSLVSAALLILILAFICVTKRWRLLLIIPPIGLAILLTGVTTVLTFGSIHGLTLAFGPGIVGLAMDYGLHIAFSNQPARIWRANLFGLLTTVVVLVVMMLSQIPLLQQLMFFSAVGIILGSLFIYLIFKKFPTLLAVRSYGVKRPNSAAFSWLILFFVGCSIVGLATSELKLDMRQLGYQSPRTAELSQWMYTSVGAQSPLLQVEEGNAPGESLEKAASQKAWAEANGIRLSNIASFLPDLKTQQANVATWPEFGCADQDASTMAGTTESAVKGSIWYKGLPKLSQKFFEPFYQPLTCVSIAPRTLSDADSAPAYLLDFGRQNRWLTLWLPDSDEQVAKIKGQYPGVLSYLDMAMVFPRIFAQELTWMVPVSLVIAFLILVYYYRGFALASLAVTPFFSGLGLYLLMNFIFNWSMSFISVIGLVMVFGFSLDFGVFAVDLMKRTKEHPDEGIWTALTVAAVINGCGFMPLMFCHHPVLAHLGRTLFFGTIGTYVGSLWGIPGLYLFLDRKRKS